jgi:hypothetical protein
MSRRFYAQRLTIAEDKGYDKGKSCYRNAYPVYVFMC